MISLVDQVKVYWKSVNDRGGYIFPDELDELRSDSFCHYVVRDDKRAGFVILDARREQKFKDRPMV